MTWVKICGITNLDDACTAVNAGANALGFVFYDKSPRKVDAEAAREIVRSLPRNVEKVGVFVDQTADEIRNIVQAVGLTAVQLHGGRARASVFEDSRPATECVGASKVIPVIPGDSLQDGGVRIGQRAHEEMFALLIDARANGLVGGTGTTFDWEAASQVIRIISFKLPIIVAGGLSALNVNQAIGLFQPFGVDVSSGVEARPGKKDPDKVRAFVEAVRRAEKNT